MVGWVLRVEIKTRTTCQHSHYKDRISDNKDINNFFHSFNCCYALIVLIIELKSMFDDIWKEAILKAAPIMVMVIVFSTVALLPAYLMTGILIKQQQGQQQSIQVDLARQVH